MAKFPDFKVQALVWDSEVTPAYFLPWGPALLESKLVSGSLHTE